MQHRTNIDYQLTTPRQGRYASAGNGMLEGICELYTIEDARTYMKENGAAGCKEIIKDGAGKTTPLNGEGFYAVANRVKPGIYRLYQ